MSVKGHRRSQFWTPERLRYWRDFDAALPSVGEAGAYLYAGTRKLIRNAKAKKSAQAKPKPNVKRRTR